MLNFYPGPSKLYSFVPSLAAEAFSSGIVEKNHRSPAFMTLLEECIFYFKQRFSIPSEYQVILTSSATECWEICAQSILRDTTFYYNGAFGGKWYSYTKKLKNGVDGVRFSVNDPVEFEANTDVCFVINETSNGTCISSNTVVNTDGLVIVDAVSGFGGVHYSIENADVWIACSQKCLGLPAGLGIMVLSPKAIQRAEEVNDNKYYNSVIFVLDNFRKFQTPYTPNILGIYLLKRLLDNIEDIGIVADRISSRAKDIYSYFDNSPFFSVLVQKKELRSDTVLCIKCQDIVGLKDFMQKHSVLLGNGYGEWKDDTFRLANFPAIPDGDFNTLFGLLDTFAGH